MSFEKLGKTELLRTAEEDFAVEVDKSDSKQKITQALLDHGVEWSMYLTANPEQAEKYAEIPANVVNEPLFKPADPVQENDGRRVLIKMVRENPLYEVRGYRFTKTNPFVLVKEDDAEFILLKEEGFRQATPGELREYYG